MKLLPLLAALCALAAAPAFAGDIAVNAPWARASAPGAPNGAAYMEIITSGKDADTLVAASTPAAAKAELHTHLMDEGVMKMRPVDSIEVAPGSPQILKPGGHHVMLMGLKEPLKPGTSFPLTLTFAKGGTLTVDVAVKEAGAMGAGAMGAGHQPMHQGQMHGHPMHPQKGQ